MTMDEEFLMISGIQHFIFCRRQWALIHVEQLWNDNLRTVEGEIIHEKCHDESFVETRKDLLTCRGMRIFSKRLNVSGQTDVVEFKRSKNGVNLFGHEGLWQPCPIEYKRGKPKEDLSDILQLCTQVICLEEMLFCDIAEGYLFYHEVHRREKVIVTKELRQQVFAIFEEMNSYYSRGYTPKAKYSKKCRNCSLKDLCLPKMSKHRSVSTYYQISLEE